MNEDIYLGFVFPNQNEENENFTQLIMHNEIFNITNVKYRIFENEKSLEEFNDKSGQNLLAGIIFTDNTINEYTIKMNYTYVPKPSLKTIVPLIDYVNNVTDADGYLDYFVPIQLAVDQAIIQQKTKTPIHMTTRFGGLEMSINNGKKNNGISLINFVYNSALFVVAMTLPKYILFEKETGIKKTLSLIGVKSFAYYFSWISVYIILIILFCIVMVIEDIAFRSLSFMNSLLKLVFLILNGFSLLAILSFTSLFFKKTVTYMNFLNILTSYFMIIFEIEFISNSPIDLNLLDLILPGFAFNKAMMEIYFNNYLKINCVKNFFSNINLIRYAGSLIFMFAFYTLLTCFLESKLTEENQSVGFSIKRLFNKKSKNFLESSSNEERYPEAIEPMETNEKCMVEVSNILKKFDNSYCAVNDVSFKVYENEIFGILGHNGAGKTTLVNMMTGLINPNHGDIYYNGEDFFKNKFNIRKDFGKFKNFI